MTVTVNDLLDQLSEDEERKPQLQMYFDTAENYIKNAVSSDTSDVNFYTVNNVYPIYDIAVLSYAMDLWINRSTTMPATTAVDHMVGQLRGLYSSWKEAQESENLQAK